MPHPHRTANLPLLVRFGGARTRSKGIVAIRRINAIKHSGDSREQFPARNLRRCDVGDGGTRQRCRGPTPSSLAGITRTVVPSWRVDSVYSRTAGERLVSMFGDGPFFGGSIFETPRPCCTWAPVIPPPAPHYGGFYTYGPNHSGFQNSGGSFTGYDCGGYYDCDVLR